VTFSILRKGKENRITRKPASVCGLGKETKNEKKKYSGGGKGVHFEKRQDRVLTFLLFFLIITLIDAPP